METFIVAGLIAVIAFAINILTNALDWWQAEEADPRFKRGRILVLFLQVLGLIAAISSLVLARNETMAAAAASEKAQQELREIMRANEASARAELRRSDWLSQPRLIPRVTARPVTVVLGSSHVSVSSRTIVLSSSNFAVEISPCGELLVDADIRNSTGVVVAELRRSELRRVSRDAYDVNSDLFGLEVVDPDGSPVLQIWRPTNADVLSVGLWAYSADGSTIEATDGPRFTVGDAKAIAGSVKRSQPIFKYPGAEHPGVRRQ